MTCRSAILIDNFLTQDKFDEISSLVSNSPYYTGGQFEEPRDELCSKIRNLVLERLEDWFIPTPLSRSRKIIWI